MTHRAFIFLTFLLTIFDKICRTHMSFQDNGSLQNTKDTHLFTEDITDEHKQFSLSSKNAVQDLEEAAKLFLKFEPDILDFKQRTLGVPYHERVTVVNLNSNKTVIMSSISGNTVHFHSSFFEDKVIPPKGNTTFNVVFLGRQEGAIESVLHIHTSEGSVKYLVKGISAANPYRLRPLVDIRLPLNASFSPLIHMYNPHATAIQITEVYSSGGEFHLELPTGELEGPKQMWEIPPYQTRPVIRVRFNARTEANHTAYIRIKLNRSEEVLIVPLEVEVGTFPGLHASQGGLDFGIGGSLDSPKRIKLLLHNTWKKAIRVHSIVTEPDNNVVSVDFQPIKISPFGKSPTLAAYLTINWKLAHNLKQFGGHVILKSKQIPHDMIIPYWATIIPGGLLYNASIAQYLSDHRSIDTMGRNFPVTNQFNLPVAVINITIPPEAQAYFEIQNFQPTVIEPNKTVNLFTLKCNNNNNLDRFNFESYISITTNISTVRVPLLSYDGKLKMVIPFASANETLLDLGLVENESVKETFVLFTNTNPVEVNLKNWNTDLKAAKFTLVGCNTGNVTETIINSAYFNLVQCKSVKPGEYVVFLLTIKAPSMEGQLWGELNIETQFEKIVVPVTIRSALGKFVIEPEKVIFDDCFPNTVCKQTLQVHSTFNKGMDFIRLDSLPFDKRFSYELITNKTSQQGDPPLTVPIVPKVAQPVANLYFDPSLACTPECFTGFTLNSTVGPQWFKSFTLFQTTLDFDLNLLNTMYGRYLNVTSKGLARWQNLTLRLDTTEVKSFIFNTRVKIIWPRLLNNYSSTEYKSFLTFPTTQVGNVSTQTLTFYNPSMSSIILHLVMESAYPGGRKLYEQLPNGFKRIYPNTSGISSTTFYFDQDQLSVSTEFEQLYNSSKHPDTVLLKLDSGKSVDLKIHFNASSPSLKSTLLYVRNNLTVIEIVRLVGQGAYPQLKFGNRKPGSSTPLTFEMTDKHLKDCEKERLRKNPSPNLTVKRSFTARNIGDVSIYFHGFYIDGYECEGFGFRVLNCEPFDLAPNETRKVEIAFTPDFTLAKIQRTLIIDTSLDMEVNYTIVTTVPPYFLAPCSLVLARPNWETLLYYMSFGLTCFMFICIIMGAFLEADRIIQTTIAVLTRDTFTMQQPLDLRLVGIKNDKLAKTEVETDNTKCHDSDQHQVNVRQKDLFSVNNCMKNNISNSWSSSISPTTSDQNQKNRKTIIALTTPNTSPLVPIKSAKKKNNLVKKNSNELPTTNNHNHSTVSVPSPVTTSSDTHKNDNKKLLDKVVIIRNKTNTSPNSNSRKKIDDVVELKKAVVQKVKKHMNVKKRLSAENNVTMVSEEDTSSTTTEYSNHDEGDKENLTKNENKTRNKVVLKVNHDYRDNYEGDDEDAEKKTVTHSTHWKLKSEAVKSKIENSNQINSSNEKEKETHKRMNRNNIREKKEKMPNSMSYGNKKQRNMEKSHLVNGKIGGSTTSPEIKYNINSSASRTITPPSACWGENRARFSDVVAGGGSHNNDSTQSSNNTATLQTPRSLFGFEITVPKISDNSENVIGNGISSTSGGGGSSSSVGSSGHAQLGPIGSKKSSVNIWESVPTSNTKPLESSLPSNDNSFFANSFLESPSTGQQPTLDGGCLGANTPGVNYSSDLWDTHTSAAVISMLHNSARSMLGDYAHLNYYPNNYSSFWGTDTGFLPPPVGEERQQLSQNQQQSTAMGLGSNVSSFWNASPWTVQSDAATRTPPGFPARPQQRDEQQMEHEFDPFRSLSNIWNPSRAPPSS